MKAELFKSRSAFLSSALLVWSILITGFLFYFSVINRERYIQSRDVLSKRTGVIVAQRGSILDKSGIPLAWNETSFDLVVISPPKNELVADQMFTEARVSLQRPIKNVKWWEEGTVLYPALTIEMMERIKELCLRYSSYLAVKRRIFRKYYDHVSVRSLIGVVDNGEQGMAGISGFEFSYDETLRGTNGMYSIMVGRSGQWLPGEWEEIREAITGDNVTLALTVQELIGGK